MIGAIRKEKKSLTVETKTTGFSSPATDYTEKRLDIGDLIAPNPLNVFYFRVGKEISGEEFSYGDILAVDRGEDPIRGDLCLGVNEDGDFSIYKFGINNAEHWGKITWIIKKVNG